MNDRRKLLALALFVMAAVVTASVATTAYHFQVVGKAGEALQPAEDGIPAGAAWWRAVWMSATCTLIYFIAGGTLVLRAINPFMCRLQAGEAHMRAIVETTADGIITADGDGRITSFNPACETMFGYRRDEAVGSPARLVLRGLDNGAKSPDGPSHGAKPVMEQAEYVGVRRDGTTFPVEVSAGKVCCDGRSMITYVVRDATERKRVDEVNRRHCEQLEAAAAALEEKTRALEASNEHLDDFTYIVSHDLKEPLRGIRSYCEIINEEYGNLLDGEGRRMLASAAKLCDRLGHLIDDLLSYSRIGPQRLERGQVELDNVLDEVLESLGPGVAERGAVVRRHGRLPVVRADESFVGEVLQNLITNALKFNRSQPPVVEIGSLPGEPAIVFVRDNGIGIEERHRENVFEMFRRLHGRRDYPGTGAGLTIVRKIVEAHGGRVWFESQPEVGTTFHFTLAPDRAASEFPPPASRSVDHHVDSGHQPTRRPLATHPPGSAPVAGRSHADGELATS